uniref:Uncharacterized protein n=1 Tax=Fagus sylvatica TaxID=28930 RepID=A0A2N9GPX6_FAGSY
MLTSFEPPLSTDCCIYRVPDDLRKLNEAAYTPKVISIGPFHHGNIRLQTMEKQKVGYLKSFMERENVVITLETLVSTIKQREGGIRRCYREAIQLSSDDFVKMILLDVSFILEYFWKCWCSWTSDDSLWLINALIWDLVLLENQIPFFIIEELFGLAFPFLSNSSPSLIQLTVNFFSDFNDQNIPSLPDVRIKHFTDLLRTFQLPQTQGLPPRCVEMIKHLYSATQLHEAGEKFKVSSSKCLLDLKFTNGVLEIPCIQLEDKTESHIRNLMAFEQYHYIGQAYITDYYFILDFLINTTRYVDLLCKKGIMVNYLGDSNAATLMVNRLNNEIVWTNLSSNYCFLSEDLNEFYENRWQNWKATLKRDYFSTPWRTASTIAAVILLVLTFIQTVCSIIQLLPKHK